MTEVETAITREIEQAQAHAASAWRGMEKQAVIELVRSLDAIAVARALHSAGTRTDISRDLETYAPVGAAAALRPFLAAIKNADGGVPWGESHPAHSDFAYGYLKYCGELSHLRRIAALEHFGLAKGSMTSHRKAVIETTWGRPELAARYSHEMLRSNDVDLEWPLSERNKRLSPRMRSYVDLDPRYLIRYDNDQEIVSTYRRCATQYASQHLEGEALPSDVPIAGRTFGEWKRACDWALGRVLTHIDFSLELKRKHKYIALRDVLTMFSRREDTAEVWREAGLEQRHIASTVDVLTLSADHLNDWQESHEAPTPFYIDFGKEFVLLPCFGALANPYFTLFRHLRKEHERDWTAGARKREAVFRQEISRTFTAPRYFVPLHGIKLRRPDGSELTDIDAAALDRETGTLALIQLKWHDIFGRSLAERNSRRKHINRANEWVERVSAWIGGRSSADIAKALGLRGRGSDAPPVLYVVARYIARFSGDGELDSRAAWLGWPEILAALEQYDGSNPLADLPGVVAQQQSALFADMKDIVTQFKFRGLEVELHVSSSFSH